MFRRPSKLAIPAVIGVWESNQTQIPSLPSLQVSEVAQIKHTLSFIQKKRNPTIIQNLNYNSKSQAFLCITKFQICGVRFSPPGTRCHNRSLYIFTVTVKEFELKRSRSIFPKRGSLNFDFVLIMVMLTNVVVILSWRF